MIDAQLALLQQNINCLLNQNELLKAENHYLREKQGQLLQERHDLLQRIKDGERENGR